MLSTVRLPTAQLGVFSVLLQVFADHLLPDKSAKEVKAAFNSLLDRAATPQDAGHRTPRFKTEDVAVCMSSRHWYPHAAL
jgi:hypothetical protein